MLTVAGAGNGILKLIAAVSFHGAQGLKDLRQRWLTLSAMLADLNTGTEKAVTVFSMTVSCWWWQQHLGSLRLKLREGWAETSLQQTEKHEVGDGWRTRGYRCRTAECNDCWRTLIDRCQSAECNDCWRTWIDVSICRTLQTDEIKSITFNMVLIFLTCTKELPLQYLSCQRLVVASVGIQNVTFERSSSQTVCDDTFYVLLSLFLSYHFREPCSDEALTVSFRHLKAKAKTLRFCLVGSRL